MIAADDPLVVALTEAVQAGDLERLDHLLASHPQLALERFGDAQKSCEALHLATDWPGHWPDVVAVVERLVQAGARVDARFAGPHTETPLHWAASSDDVAALDALLDAGADIEAGGAVLTGGSPIDDAVVFAQWRAARRLLERGADIQFWHAAALGLTERVMRDLAAGATSGDEITGACWHAARAGHLTTVVALVDAGADLQEVLWEDRTVLDAAVAASHDEVAAFVRSRGAGSAGIDR